MLDRAIQNWNHSATGQLSTNQILKMFGSQIGSPLYRKVAFNSSLVVSHFVIGCLNKATFCQQLSFNLICSCMLYFNLPPIKVFLCLA